jgi:hypothetical protein
MLDGLFTTQFGVSVTSNQCVLHSPIAANQKFPFDFLSLDPTDPGTVRGRMVPYSTLPVLRDAARNCQRKGDFPNSCDHAEQAK